ncbi:MAG: malonic semialdehyde reductase [Sphingomonadales bacterium]
MKKPLDDAGLDLIFREARSFNRWAQEKVSDDTLKAIVDLMKWGATSANCWPMRLVFVKSAEAKARLKPHLDEFNVEKVLTAPAVAIIAYDSKFYDRIPELFPHNPGARDWFAHDQDVAFTTAFRNGTLQGAYLMIAARALGLDCGPMSGFNNEGVDQEFFPDGQFKSNFLCSLGVGTTEELFGRSPRPAFDSVAEIL